MSEADLQMIFAEIERLRIQCDTPEAAKRQLQSEGLLDEAGELAARYRAVEELAR